MLIADDVVVNPEEAPMVPARTPTSLSELGISVLDFRPGEASIDGTSVRTSTGQRLVDRRAKVTTLEMILEVKEDADVDLPTAAYRLQQMFGSMQERETWIMRVPKVGGNFAGPILYKITGVVSLGDFAGWGRGDQPDVRLVLERDPVGYSTEEREQGPFTSVPGERHLIFDEVPSPGTADGLWRGRFTNEGEEDLRGLILSRECLTAPEDLEDPTAQPHYLAKDLTVKGGAEVVAGPTEAKVRAVGAVAAGAGSVSPGLPAGTKKGDLLLMFIESGGATAGTEANVEPTAEGWSLAATQKAGNTRLTILYRIATGTDSTATSDTGDHQLARIVGVEVGTFEPSEPINVTGKGSQATTKAVSIPGATTTFDNCLVFLCASGSLPDNTSTAEFGAATNAALTSLTERVDNTTNSGDGGALYVATGVKATKGAYGATTLTAVTEAERAVISLAINAPIYVQHKSLTAGWITVLESEIEGVGHMTHLGPRVPWLRIYDPGEEAGGVQLRLLCRALGASQWDESLPILSTPVVNGWIPVKMGVARPATAVLGDQRWEFRLQLRAPGGSGALRIRDVYPLATEQYLSVQEPSPSVPAGTPVKPPGKAENDAGIGTVNWTELSNALTDNDTGALPAELVSAGAVMKYLKLVDFGFAIPTGTDIQGIQLRFKRAGSGARDERIRLVKGGSIQASADKASLEMWSGSMVEATYGSADDLWNNVWLPADINSSGFGVAISAKAIATALPRVARVILAVAYSEEGDSSRVCFASRSIEIRSDGIIRQQLGSDTWGPQVPDGFLPQVAPGGLEVRVTRTIMIPSVGDLVTRPDGSTPAIAAASYSRDGYHFAREAA